MDLFRRLFAKSAPRGLFSFVFPQAPASLSNPEFLRAYKGWVYACVKRKADSIATMELTLQQRSGDEWKEVSTGPTMEVLDLLTHVNPFLSSDGLYRGTSSYLDLVGNSFWYVAYNGKKRPTELWQLDPTKVEVVRSEANFIAGWIYTNPQGRKIRLSPLEVIPFQEFNPLDPYKGMGPTEAGALSIDSERYAQEWNRNFFANSAIPAMVLKTEQTLTDEQYTRLIEGWKARYQGIANAHKPAVLEGGLEIELLNKTQKELDFAAQQNVLRDQILAVFGVPKSLLGVVEDVNRANAEASEYVFAKYTLAPRMRFMATTLSEFYLPLWGLSPTKYRLYAADCVPRNDEMDLKRKETGIKNGYYLINEIRAEEGLKPVTGGDVPFLPGTLKPLDLVLNPPDPVMPGQGGQPGEDKKPPKKTLTKAPASDLVAGRIAFVLAQISTYTSKYKTLLTKQRKALVARLTAKAITDALTKRKDIGENEITDELVRLLFADWDEQIGLLVNPTRQALTSSLSEAGKRALAELDLEQTFDQNDQRVVSWLETNALQHATSIADTIKEEVKDRIIAGVTEGLGAEDIAASIGEFFDTQSQWRALRIARSEVISGYAEGTLQGFRQSEVVERKQWLTAGDSAVDPECAMNEAQGAILLDLPFASGHLAPIVHPNCRCVLQPVV
jgi:HK97 family phage portal protein